MSRGVLGAVQALTGGAAMAVVILVAVTLASRGDGTDRRARGRAPGIAIALVLSAWFGVSSAVAAAGGFSAGTSGNLALPLLALSVAAPMTIGVTGILFVAPVRRLVSSEAVQPAVIGVHALRVVFGAVFIAVWAAGVLPAVLALPAGVGDVVVGLSAVPAAIGLRSGRRGRALAWNLLGVYDLVQAIAIAVVVSTGPLQLLSVSPGTDWMTVPPLSVVPTFVVPLYLLLHVVSLRFLAGRRVGLSVAAPARVEARA
ncbi:MAG TPA: MFS transporter [Candidatus Dormibacteraeota bacterium]|nr:MFS transporter [Candidatus Dormibacteraeota bacterium]